MSNNHSLPPAEKSRLTLGFMRVSDCAPLVIARERGYFAAWGLEVSLQRETSWANLRDRLIMGELDAAQMLAPLPLITRYGAGGVRADLSTGLVLSLNGNAITLSTQSIRAAGIDVVHEALHPRHTAQQLAALLRSGSGDRPFTLATVHLFSTHTFVLRRWLAAGGIDPDREVRIVVLPPEQMCDSLARGDIDGFCVGEPWNTLAVQQGTGSVAATGVGIWNNAPEKVLCVTDAWHAAYPATHARLRLALMQACRALADRDRREEAAGILSDASYLDLPAAILLPSLTGDLRFQKGAPARRMADFHVFWDYQACFPWHSHAELLLAMSAELLGHAPTAEAAATLIRQCQRTDLYRESARQLGVAAPDTDCKGEDQHDSAWEMAPGILLGADRLLSPAG